MSKINIVLILKNSMLNRGMNTGLETLVWGLAERGLKVHIISGGEEPKESRCEIPNNIKYYFTGRSGITSKNTKTALKIIKEQKINCILGRVDFLLPFVNYKRHDNDFPRIIGLQGSLKNFKSYYSRKFNLCINLVKGNLTISDFKYRFFNRMYISKLDKVIAISKAVQDNADKYFKVSKTENEIIYCGVDNDLYKYKERINMCYTERKVKLLFAGNLSEAKGVGNIIKAASLLNFPVEIVLCGN